MYRPYGLPSNILLFRNIVALYLIVVIFVFSGLIKSTHGYNSNGLSHHNSPPVFDFKRDWIIKETEPLGKFNRFTTSISKPETSSIFN